MSDHTIASLRCDVERWIELLEDVLQDIGEGLTSEAIVEAREALADEQRRATA